MAKWIGVIVSMSGVLVILAAMLWCVILHPELTQAQVLRRLWWVYITGGAAIFAGLMIEARTISK